MRRLAALAMTATLVAACNGSSAVTSTTGTSTTTPSTATSSTTAPSTTTSSTMTSSTRIPSTVLPDPIPVGPGGIEYSGGSEEIEVTGPTRFAVGPDGSVHVYDPVGDALWSWNGADWSTVDLLALDVLNVEQMTASKDGLVLVEIFFSPVRHRVHRMSLEGEIVETVELPEGARLEDGLSGVIVDDADRIGIQLQDGSRFAFLSDEGLAVVDAVEIGGLRLAVVTPDFSIDGRLVSADITSLGGFELVGATGGVVVLLRAEVVSLSPIEVLSTIEWYSSDGTFLGSALVPQAQAISAPPGVAVAPDGRVLALVAGETMVSVVELTPEPERIVAG